MQILIHIINNSLFLDVDPGSVTRTGLPPEIVTIQSTLYASLATSLLAASLAMFGKQWVNLYVRNHGGSAADKSRERRRRLDGLDTWHFQLVIESLPPMLQLALLLLGCALSLYLWTISRAVAWVLIGFTTCGVAAYVFFTLAATFYYNCPYQTPHSILTRAFTRYLAHSSSTFTRLVRSLMTPLADIYSLCTKNLCLILKQLRAGVRSALLGSGCILGVQEEIEHIPLATVELPDRFFQDVPIDWMVRKTDARCISWVLHSTTDTDIIFSTVRFAAVTILYPEIAKALSLNIPTDLFLDCLSDG